jgi:hypothetical protein
MRHGLISVTLVAILLVFGGSPLLAQKGKGKGKGKQQESAQTAGDKVRTALPEGERVFTQQERVVVTNWFRDNRSGLPPGLAKRDRLPPGLEKQLRERGTLPPGLQKKIQPLPVALERQLQPLPTGWRRVVIAGNVVLMNERTSTVYDIIRNAIP